MKLYDSIKVTLTAAGLMILVAAAPAAAAPAGASSQSAAVVNGLVCVPSMPATDPASCAAVSASGRGVVDTQSVASLGTVLVTFGGMTLYYNTNDTPGNLWCTGKCAGFWPPLLIPPGSTPAGGPGVSGDIGTITRPDGSVQVTYDGHPLYRFVKDGKPGDANGNNLKGIWHVMPPAGPSTAQVTVGAKAVGKLGTILVTSDGMTLYYVTKDSPTSIWCTGGCASIWPPLIVPSGEQLAAGAGVTGTLSTVKRPDGSLQAAYDGHPLYTFAGDSAAGQANGQGVKGIWFVMPAAGVKGAGSP